MNLSDKGLALIEEFEGYHTALPDGSCKAYLDTLAKPPVWTIGFGCTEGVTAGLVETRAQADERFRRELAKHEAIVTRLVNVEIGQNNFDALVSFSYNTGALAKSTLLRKLNARDFDGAAKEFARYNKAGGKVWKGLVRRRAAERALFEQDARDPEIAPGQPDMPQAVEEPGKVTTGQFAAAAVPPAAITTGLTLFEAWQTIGDKIGANLAWMASKPVTAAVVALTVAAYVLIPRRST